VFVVVHLFRFILRAPRVNSEVLYAGVATYLMLGLLWAFAYIMVALMIPNSFAFTVSAESGQSIHGFNGLYFSLITLSTVGYGDIVPVLPAARMLAMTEAMTGTIYVAVLISRLVALHSSARANDERK
jgi:Ion channel